MCSLGALPALWLQAKLTISLAPFQEEVCQTLPHNCCGVVAERTFRNVPSSGKKCSIRLAERLAKYICSLIRHAATLATPETECLLYATYWFRPILSELSGAATETVLNRSCAPSGPVKVTVTTQPHERPHGGIGLTSSVSALLAWSRRAGPAKLRPAFLLPKEVHCNTCRK